MNVEDLVGYDNTKLSTYKSCPRKYFFRHVMHWRQEGIAVDLTFGLAWHEAMDMVWQLANQSAPHRDILQVAYAAFKAKWLEEGLPDPDTAPPEAFDSFKAKTPGIAFQMLNSYIANRYKFLQNIELLGVEKPFMVPIFPQSSNIFYIGRLDKVFRSDGRVITGEHKTTGQYQGSARDNSTRFRDDYIQSWSPNSQIDGYNYAGRMLYGSDFKAVWVDAVLCHAKVHDKQKFIPIDRGISHLDSWLSDTRSWIARVQEDEYNFELESEQTHMESFPCNTGSCYDYGRPCSYKDVCQFISNPRLMDGPPEGMVVDKWEPFDILGITEMLQSEAEEEQPNE